MKLFSTLCLLFSLSFAATAEVVVIVSVNNPNTYTGLEKGEIERIFLGKTSRFPDGSAATAYGLPKGSAERQAFARRYLGRSESQLNSYWARRVFAGKQQPPKTTNNATEMKQKVAGNPNAIGYLDSADVDASVVVIHQFK
jgi:ABC-type phosphate transport system substrate-binding protein